MKIGNFLFSLVKCGFDLFFRKSEDEIIDQLDISLEEGVNSLVTGVYADGQKFALSGIEDRCIDKRLVEKDKIYSKLIKHFIILKSFLSVTAHTGDTVKYDGVFLFYLAYELVPLRSALRGSGIELVDNGSLRIKLGDVGDLSCDSLVFGRYAAIGIDHNITFLSALKLTTASFDAIIMPCIC